MADRFVINTLVNLVRAQTEPGGSFHMGAMCTGGQRFFLENRMDADTQAGLSDIRDQADDRCLGMQSMVRDRYPALAEARTVMAGDFAARVRFRCADGRVRSEPLPEAVMDQIDSVAAQNRKESGQPDTEEAIISSRVFAATRIGADFAEDACTKPSEPVASPVPRPRSFGIGY